MSMEAIAWYQVESWILTWAPIIFMGLLVFFIWRTMKLMPRTKPQQIKPESSSSITWDQVAGADEAKAELAEYHGVEHKAIAAYEQDALDAADADKEHERCGSHLVTPMLVSNVAGTLLLRRAVERPGAVAGGAVAIASTAVAVEVFAWCERNAETRLARALRRPGFEIQRVVGTREPDERQLEVGRAALAEILRVEAAEAA